MKKTILMLLLVVVIILLGIITYEPKNTKPVLLPIENTLVTDTVTQETIQEESISSEESDEEFLYNLTIPEQYKEKEYEFYNKYYTEANLLGDATGVYIQESNYPQLDTFKTSTEKRAYDSTINIDVALFNSTFMNEHSTTLSEHIEDQKNKLSEILKYYSEINPDVKTDQKCYYKLNGMLIVTNDDRKPKKIKITINDSKPLTVTLNNTDKYQLIDLNYTQDNTNKPVNVKIDIISSYNNVSNPDDTHLYIEDVKFGIESNIPQGR